MGWDGSRHCKAYGHDFISVSIVGPGFADAVPVYVKIARGRRSKGDLLNAAIEAVKKVVGENGWFAVDRGMDSVEFIFFTDECGSQTKVLVVESRVGGHPIWLYVTCPDSAFEDEAEMQRLAILAAQAYRNRWQIERSFETVKQGFSLEKLRVRTFRRLKNVFSPCVVAYLFVMRYLRASSRFKGIVKAIRDNCTERSMTTHPLLANLRSLIGEERIRNITGRPRKPPEKEPDQLEFAFPDAA